LGLPEDWLNDAVKGLLPGNDDARALPDVSGIEITSASPRYLLAMKLLAMRFGEEDDDDIKVLIHQAGVTSAEESLDLDPHVSAPRATPQDAPLSR
jgi:hypothetical protein